MDNTTRMNEKSDKDFDNSAEEMKKDEDNRDQNIEDCSIPADESKESIKSPENNTENEQKINEDSEDEGFSIESIKIFYYTSVYSKVDKNKKELIDRKETCRKWRRNTNRNSWISYRCKQY